MQDTICYDPFFQEMPKFFKISFKEARDTPAIAYVG